MGYKDEEVMPVVEPWACAVASKWRNASTAIILGDMGACLPTSALSADESWGTWCLSSYEAGEVAGRMIWVSADGQAPPVRLPLPATGWHAIFVGLYGTRDTPCKAWLKLDGDAAPVPRATSPEKGYWGLEEVFLRAADLREQNLHIAPQASGLKAGCGIAYVKLVALTPEEISALLADRADTSHRNLVATCDGVSFMYERQPTTVEELLSEVEIFRHTDFGRLLLHVGVADHVPYPSRFGQMVGEGCDTFPHVGYRHLADSVREFARQGINPVQVLIDGAHELGIKVEVGIRPGGWTYYEPYTRVFMSRFYRDHPDWRTVDRDGTPVARMSWAVPEVRAHLVDVLREAVQLGADGAHIVFNRGFPMVLWEPPFCRLFGARYGLDPRELAEDDPRVQDLQREVVAAFVADVRRMLDEEQSCRSGGRLSLSACVLGNEADNLRYALDVRRLAAAGLVDEVHSYKYGFGASEVAWDMGFLNEACGPRGVKVYPMFSIGAVNEPDMRDAVTLCREGADGLGFWDVATRAGDGRLWPILSRFGRPDEMGRRLDEGTAERRFLPLHRQGEEVLDGRYPIYWGG